MCFGKWEGKKVLDIDIYLGSRTFDRYEDFKGEEFVCGFESGCSFSPDFTISFLNGFLLSVTGCGSCFA